MPKYKKFHTPNMMKLHRIPKESDKDKKKEKENEKEKRG